MFKMKYSIHRMQCNIFSQQVGWFNGKGFYFHSKGQEIKLHEWCCVWSTKVNRLNILLSGFL